MNEFKSRFLRIDQFIVDTFEGLIRGGLSLLCLGSIVILPFVLFPLSIASFISNEWLEGLGYLFLILLMIYTVRGLYFVLKNKKEELVSFHKQE